MNKDAAIMVCITYATMGVRVIHLYLWRVPELWFVTILSMKHLTSNL